MALLQDNADFITDALEYHDLALSHCYDGFTINFW